MVDTADKSVGLLNKIFDYSGALDAIAGTSGGVVNSAILKMFEVFNSFAMVAVGLAIIAIWAVAIMRTAQEGIAVTKRINLPFFATRTVIAIIFIAPFPGMGGLSVLQGLIVGSVAVSVQGGNMLFAKSLEFFERNSGSLMPLGTSTGAPSPQLLAALTTGALCVEHANAHRTRNALGITSAAYSIQQVSWGSKSAEIRFGADGLFKHGDQCGAIRFECAAPRDGSAYSGLCYAERDAAAAMLASVEGIARDVYAGRLPSSNSEADQARLQAAVNVYKNAWEEAARGAGVTKRDGVYVVQLSEAQEARVSNFVKEATAGGWITAGQWYWTLAASSMEAQNLSKSTVEFVLPQFAALPEVQEAYMPRLAQLQDMLGSLAVNFGDGRISFASAGARAAGGAEGGGLFGEVGKVWNGALGSGAHVWHEAVFKDNDPIRTLAGYGQWMIAGGTSVLAGATALRASADGVDKSIAGTVANAAGGGAFWSLARSAATILSVLAAWLIGTGGLLAYYLPAVPLLYWCFAVLGWVIMVFESLLAAPLWAASHATSEGDGFAGRYALQGYQLFVNVVLRPIMLTIGLLASMFVMHGITLFTVWAYSIFNAEMVNSTSTTAIWGFVFTNTIMVILVIVMSHKAHEMIYDTADNVMRWIGFGVSPLGAVKAEGEVKGMAKGGSATTERFVGAAIGKAAGVKDPRVAPGKTEPANQAGGTPVTQRPNQTQNRIK